tara:strand:+ start:631 stop:1089 length:459 start_codon:yes stop_codon:yes gene_type:complete
MNNFEFNINEFDVSDESYLWMWRNDPLTREMFINKKKVSWFEHIKWLGKIKEQRNTKIYIGKKMNYERIGMCRFQENKEKNVEVSISIYSKFRGKGFSSLFLKLSSQKYLKFNQTKLIAIIRKENLASIKCFSGCGFSIENEDEKFYFYKKN